MLRLRYSSALVLLFSFLILSKSYAQTNSKHIASVAYGNLPLIFEANEGQAAPGVQFLSHGQGYTLLLSPSEITIALPPARQRKAHDGQSLSAPSILGMALVHTNPRASSSPELPQATRTNYFLGNDPAKWRIGIPSYARLRYRAIYPGIDLVYYGNQRHLEHDFIVAPHSNPAQIQLSFTGGANLSIDKETGDLLIYSGSITPRLLKPVSYQQIHGQRREIASRFTLLDNQHVSFALGSYDDSQPLIIDPILVYSTYLGGSGQPEQFGESGVNLGDTANAITLGADGSAYIAGSTYSTDFPLSTNAFQTKNKATIPTTTIALESTAFISKLNATGTALVYSTYLGGSGFNTGDEFGDAAFAIAVDAANNAYIAGATGSKDFPVTPGAFQTTYPQDSFDQPGTVFVTKLNATGSALIYSTFIGGYNLNNPGQIADFAHAIAVDLEGNAYIAGSTLSNNFPTTPSTIWPSIGWNSYNTTHHAFLSKLNPSGTALVYSTYLGGGSDDSVNAMAIDANGNAYVTGTTDSTNFPTTAGAYEPKYPGKPAQWLSNPVLYPTSGFVSKINSSATSYLYSTYLGGSGMSYFPPPSYSLTVQGDSSAAIAIDADGNAWVGGLTHSPDFPTTVKALSNIPDINNGAGFVTEVNPTGTDVLASTLLGAGGTSVTALAADSDDNVYLIGNPGTSLPLTPDAISSQDCCTFIAKMNSTATAFNYATYFGGSGKTYANALALDGSGNLFVTGGTTSKDMPTTPGVYQTTNKATSVYSSNAFISEFGLATETSSYYGTAITLTANSALVKQGQPLTLTVQVTSSSGGTIPTGQVTIAAINGSASFSAITLTLNASGVATWSSSTLAPGLYSLSATYANDSTHLASSVSNGQLFRIVGPPVAVAFGQDTGSGGQYGSPDNGVYVTVSDSAGYALDGVTVNFSGANLTFSPSVIVTSNGNAHPSVLPTKAGNLVATATVAGLPPATFNILVYQAYLSVQMQNVSRLYGAHNPVFLYEVSSLVNGDTLGGTVTITPSTTATAASPVGNYPITAILGGINGPNYYLSLTAATLTVLKAPLYLSARNVAITYGQTPSALNAYTLTGFVNGDTASVVTGSPVLTTSVTATTPVGFYPITVATGSLAAQNYSFNTFSNGEGSVGVYKAPLHIKPNSVTIHAGDPLPSFTYMLSGFVNGDTQASATTGAASITTTATTPTKAGRYYIIGAQGSLQAHNYGFLSDVTDYGILTVLP